MHCTREILCWFTANITAAYPMWVWVHLAKISSPIASQHPLAKIPSRNNSCCPQRELLREGIFAKHICDRVKIAAFFTSNPFSSMNIVVSYIDSKFVRQGQIDIMSALFPAIYWCRKQVDSHCLNQCWPSLKTCICVTRPPCAKWMQNTLVIHRLVQNNWNLLSSFRQENEVINVK